MAIKYSDEFNEWWAKRSKSVPKARRAVVKRWCWIGWSGVEEYEQQMLQEQAEQIAADEAAGINIHSPGYWGDFS